MSADIIVRGDCNDCACNFYHDCAAAQSNGSSTSNFIPMCVCGHTISQHPVLRALSRNTVTGELQVIFTATTTIVPPTCVNCESNNFKSLSTSALVAKPTPLRSVKSTQSRPNSRRDALKTPTGEVRAYDAGLVLIICHLTHVSLSRRSRPLPPLTPLSAKRQRLIKAFSCLTATPTKCQRRAPRHTKSWKIEV